VAQDKDFCSLVKSIVPAYFVWPLAWGLKFSCALKIRRVLSERQILADWDNLSTVVGAN
jgi:hypothetical protein